MERAIKQVSTKRRQKVPKRHIGSYIVLSIGALSMIIPFIWMILTSLKTLTETTRIPPTILPDMLRFDNYVRAWDSLPFGSLFYNTFIMMAVRIILCVIFSSMAGFAFAKLEFKFKKLMFTIVIIQLMLPAQIFIIPQYMMVAKLGLLNTVAALVFPGIVSAFGVFFMRQFYTGIPDELIEAAYLDGANTWQIFIKIIFPLSKTPLIALSIFTAIFAWGDLMWPLIVNMSVDKMTLSSGLASLKGQMITDYPVLMAGAFIAMVPMVILYAVFQKQFVEGIALTGGK